MKTGRMTTVSFILLLVGIHLAGSSETGMKLNSSDFEELYFKT
jgi:hypothetical protein